MNKMERLLKHTELSDKIELVKRELFVEVKDKNKQMDLIAVLERDLKRVIEIQLMAELANLLSDLGGDESKIEKEEEEEL